MNSDINTLELAKLYESQGYNDKAHEIYSVLDQKEPSDEITAGLERTRKGLSSNSTEDPIQEDTDTNSVYTEYDPAGKRIALLLEQWIELLVVKQRLDKFKRIKARLV